MFLRKKDNSRSSFKHIMKNNLLLIELNKADCNTTASRVVKNYNGLLFSCFIGYYAIPSFPKVHMYVNFFL